MLGELSSVEALSSAWFTGDCNFERLETALFAEFFLHSLDIGSESALAMPLEATFFLLFFLLFTLFLLGAFRYKYGRGLRLDVEHHEFLPVQVQVKWGLLWMYWRVFKRDVVWLGQAGTDTARDRLDELLLRGSLGIVNTEDVLLLGRSFHDFFDHTSQIFYVNCG